MNEPGESQGGSGQPQGSVALVVVTLGLLATLVLALNPSQPKLTPAPLNPQPAECPRSQQEFVPSNVTDFPDAALQALSGKTRNRALFRMNMDPCACGCVQAIAACRVSRPQCEPARALVEKLAAEVQAEPRPPPDEGHPLSEVQR